MALSVFLNKAARHPRSLSEKLGYIDKACRSINGMKRWNWRWSLVRPTNEEADRQTVRLTHRHGSLNWYLDEIR